MKRKMFRDEAGLLHIHTLAEVDSALLPITETPAWLYASSSDLAPVFTHAASGCCTDCRSAGDLANIFPVLTFNGQASCFNQKIGSRISFPFADCHYSLIVLSEQYAICDQSIGYSCYSENGRTDYDTSVVGSRIRKWYDQYRPVINKEADYHETDPNRLLILELEELTISVDNAVIASSLQEIRQTMDFLLCYYVKDISSSIHSIRWLFQAILPELIGILKDYVKFQSLRGQSDTIQRQLLDIENTILYLKKETAQIKERAIEWKGMEIHSSISLLKQSFAEWKSGDKPNC